MLEAAERQQIPYSVLKLSSAPEIGDGRIRVAEARSTISRGVRITADAKAPRKFPNFEKTKRLLQVKNDTLGFLQAKREDDDRH